MLTYTLTRREKALILVLAVFLVAVAWFVLVFQRTGGEIAAIETEIADVESEISIGQVRLANLQSMEASVAAHEESGERAVAIPEYDNMTPLMAELNRVLAAAATYAISFDELGDSDTSGYVRRGVKIDYGCDSYDAAKAIVGDLANGSFPCIIDTVSINESASGASAQAGVSVSLHLTYLERD